MSPYKHPFFALLLMASIIVTSLFIHSVSWSGAQMEFTHQHKYSEKKLYFEESRDEWINNNESRSSRRMMIGSVAPRCSYNECRGCKYKCRAEQVPVETNDPLHSSYHYRCLCQR